MTPIPLLEDSPNEAGGESERRQKPRIYAPFPMRVKGRNLQGSPFKVWTFLDNLSASGVYFHLRQPVSVGDRLTGVFKVNRSGEEQHAGLVILIHGEVVRVEPQPEELWGVALRFEGRSYR